MRGRFVVLGLTLAGCDPPAPAPPAGAPDGARPEVAAADERGVVASEAARAGPPVPKDWSWAIEPVARPSLTQVAALGPERALALGDGRLYALDGDRWRVVPVAQGRPKAVAEGDGALWALVEGEGGRTLVLRAQGCCALDVAEDMPAGTVKGPGALAVTGRRDLYVAGESPRLVRVVEGKARTIAVDEPIVALAVFAGDARTPGPVVVAMHGPGRARLVRGDVAEPAAPLPDGTEVAASRGWLLTRRDGQVRAGLAAGLGDMLSGEPGPKGGRLGLTPAGAPIVALPDAVAVWNPDATAIEHTSEPDGSRGYFSAPRPAWAWIRGALPREPIAVLPTEPRLVAGREGELARIEAAGGTFAARAIVEVARPRALAIVAERRTAIGVAGALVAGPQGPRRIDVGEAGRSWLGAAARDARPGGPPVFAAAGARGILLAQPSRADALRIDDDGARTIALPSWPRAIAATGAGTWVVLLGHGAVVAIEGETTRAIGELHRFAPSGVAHPSGAFTGADGRVRLVASRTPLVCTDGATLERCGDDPGLEPAHLYPLRDGLLSLTQAVRTRIVDAAGGREIDNLWARGEPIAVGGPAAAPVAIVAPQPAGPPVLLRLGAKAWETAAAIPASCVPQAVASDGARVMIACEGEAVLELK